MGDLLELDEANPFRIRAFRRGAQILESHSSDVSQLERKELLSIPGIGKGIADIIEEYKTSHKVTDLEVLKKKYPPGVLEIMNIPGMGPRRAAEAFKTFKIDSLDKLSKAAKANQLTQLPGFGSKLQESILKNLSFAAESSKRILLPEALSISSQYQQYLSGNASCQNLQIAGSLRRWKETIGDLDFLCTSNQPEKVITHFTQFPYVERVLASGKTKASVLLNTGLQCDLRVVDPQSHGAALLYFTGSKEHNVRLRELARKKGYTLNEYGLFRINQKKNDKPIASRTEKDMYRALGLPWIPPELREDNGEMEAGLANQIPNLVTEDDILGDLHNHTDLSDGADSMEDMIRGAREKKWKWYFCGDHSPNLKITSGLSTAALREKMAKATKIQKGEKNFFLGVGSEVDILAGGEMDYPDAVLEEIGCVIASIHSRLQQPKEELTDRICKALANPHVDILGHPSGRLIHTRAPSAIDYDAILETAQKTNTAIEINGQPDRLDLQDIYVKKAIRLGIPLALSTDAHSVSQLDNMRLAVHVARRGWAEKKHILNCLNTQGIQKWLKNRSF